MKSSVCVPVLMVVLTALVGSTRTNAYPSGAPAGVTGVAGEETCTKCHNSFEVNVGRAEKRGDVMVTGLPERYEAGKSYGIKVELTDEQDRMVWGFQFAARTAGGAQAGQLKPMDSHTQLQSDKGIQYVGHTFDGKFSNAFEFTWVAPERSAGDVLIGVAGNAADGDDSQHGDFIYTKSMTIPAAP